MTSMTHYQPRQYGGLWFPVARDGRKHGFGFASLKDCKDSIEKLHLGITYCTCRICAANM